MERPCRCIIRLTVFMGLLLSASQGLAQKVEWQGHARLGLGQSFEEISGISSLATPLNDASTENNTLERERRFYLTTVGATHSRATVQSNWANNVELERGDSWQGDAEFNQGSLNSSYEYRELKDRYHLGLTLSQNKGDLNYRRPPLVNLSEDQLASSTLSTYSAIQTGYVRSLDAFSTVSFEAQSSRYRQDTTDIHTQRLEFRYQQLINPFWDSSVAWNGSHQENRETAGTSQALEMGWMNNFRISLQDVLSQAIGAIRTTHPAQSGSRSSFTMALAYTHLFQNNMLLQNEALPASLSQENGQNANQAPANPATTTNSPETKLIEKIQEGEKSDSVTFSWVRNLSALEQGGEQFVTEQAGIHYNYSAAKGRQFEAGLFQRSQFAPEQSRKVQRIDQNLRLAYSELINRTERLRPELFDRLGLEFQHEQALEKRQDLRARRWNMSITYEARF